jgi:hypothetical protein
MNIHIMPRPRTYFSFLFFHSHYAHTFLSSSSNSEYPDIIRTMPPLKGHPIPLAKHHKTICPCPFLHTLIYDS